jgi:hypothetical protein
MPRQLPRQAYALAGAGKASHFLKHLTRKCIRSIVLWFQQHIDACQLGDDSALTGPSESGTPIMRNAHDNCANTHYRDVAHSLLPTQRIFADCTDAQRNVRLLQCPALAVPCKVASSSWAKAGVAGSPHAAAGPANLSQIY